MRNLGIKSSYYFIYIKSTLKKRRQQLTWQAWLVLKEQSALILVKANFNQATSFSFIISKAELAWVSLVWAVDVPCWKPELTAAEGTGAAWQCMWMSVRGCCCCLHASQQDITQKIHSLVLALQACPHLLVSSTTLIIITIYQVFNIYMHDKLSIKIYWKKANSSLILVGYITCYHI